MTDGQYNVLIAALLGLAGSIGAVVRWAVGRFIRSLDTTSAAMLKSVDANTTAMLANTVSNTRLEVKINAIADWAESHPTPPLGTQLHDLHPPKEFVTRAKTPAGGIPSVRPPTRGEGR